MIIASATLDLDSIETTGIKLSIRTIDRHNGCERIGNIHGYRIISGSSIDHQHAITDGPTIKNCSRLAGWRLSRCLVRWLTWLGRSVWHRCGGWCLSRRLRCFRSRWSLFRWSFGDRSFDSRRFGDWSFRSRRFGLWPHLQHRADCGF